MFITLTVNTKYNKRKKIKFSKRQLNPSRGWKRSLRIKRTSVFQKFSKWLQSFKNKTYRLDGQIAMY